MRQVDFKNIKGVAGIAKFFYSSEGYINELIKAEDQLSYYEEIKIRKKNYKNKDKYRVVYKADSSLSQLQKNIAEAISDNVKFPDYVQGFVKRRSSYSNARQHLAKAFLLSADICDFFDSIEIADVATVFRTLGCNNETAEALAKICTINGILSQGLHSSPVISNLVVGNMDKDFQELCSRHEAVYTRYSDDISISSNKDLPTKEQIMAILEKNGFILNTDKFKITKRGQAQFVTGLSVFDSKSPRIPKRMKRRLRLELHYIDKYGTIGHFERVGVPDFAQSYAYNRVRGHIDYVNAAEPDLAEKLYEKFPRKPNYGRIAKTLINNPKKLPDSIKIDLGLK